MPAYQLVAEHPNFIVINKSAGVHFHSQDGSAGVVAQVEADRNEKLYSVHRLDTPTSGLLLLARSSAVAATLSQQFAEHSIEKRYLALSTDKPKKKQGTIEGGMAKARRSQWKLTRAKDNYATTQFVSASVKPGLRAFLLRPLSGKTHQIRVALKSIGAPILGDALYGGVESDRTYLHAYQLVFSLNGEQHEFTQAPSCGEHYLSDELTALLQQWQQQQPSWPKR
ncbi:TIGR01621 family pseudouridine synthase [Ferrimonas lipolytica]|uniref:TIGR01621 family pseudouridine synthase n=1 Tax=Ferrimonas lipolytica TaxID=2724191 RepID=A0A6H1UI57_9GAMM|nr:TIGR01621 family pseudouridine synthase [Ferrimonas lipolytica]QIZ78290.1 TIGR01621 family pseudouridine synthase [Ferrimonas lipolytica]